MDESNEPCKTDNLRASRGIIWWTAVGAVAWVALLFLFGPIVSLWLQ